MGRRNQLIVSVVLVGLTLPLAEAGVRRRAETTISKASSEGRIVTLSTGTTRGQCAAHGRRLACYDGAALALADVEEGCFRVEGGGRCAIDVPDGAELEPGIPPALTPAESTIDVECERGEKRGRIYTVSDGDGTGSCGVNRDVDGKINGATCTKNGTECGSVSCEEGCTGANNNCTCRVRNAPRRTVAPSD